MPTQTRLNDGKKISMKIASPSIKILLFKSHHWYGVKVKCKKIE